MNKVYVFKKGGDSHYRDDLSSGGPVSIFFRNEKWKVESFLDIIRINWVFASKGIRGIYEA